MWKKMFRYNVNFSFHAEKHKIRKNYILLPSVTVLRKGNVFTSLCDSVHRGVYTPPGQTPLLAMESTLFAPFGGVLVW